MGSYGGSGSDTKIGYLMTSLFTRRKVLLYTCTDNRIFTRKTATCSLHASTNCFIYDGLIIPNQHQNCGESVVHRKGRLFQTWLGCFSYNSPIASLLHYSFDIMYTYPVHLMLAMLLVQISGGTNPKSGVTGMNLGNMLLAWTLGYNIITVCVQL